MAQATKLQRNLMLKLVNDIVRSRSWAYFEPFSGRARSVCGCGRHDGNWPMWHISYATTPPGQFRGTVNVSLYIHPNCDGDITVRRRVEDMERVEPAATYVHYTLPIHPDNGRIYEWILKRSIYEID